MATPPRPREARIKPEFAHLYPLLKLNVWEPASTMADRLLAWLLRQHSPRFVEVHRVMQPEHFISRDGSPIASLEARRREERPGSADE
jgi:hypothetical protein